MRTAAIAAGLCLSMTGPWFAQASTAVVTRFETQIPPQALGSALVQFSKLDHLHVLYLTAEVERLRTSGASGYLTADETLHRLLSNTGLRYRYVTADTVSIISGQSEASEPQNRIDTGNDPSSKHKEHTPSAPDHDPPAAPHPSKRKSAALHEPSALREVVVTGTLIPGVQNLASPLRVFSRAEIDASGASTLQQFMQQQSFNWGGGAAEGTVGELAGGGTADNRDYGSGINLRGLGNDATLVLIDGHRIAPGNTDANFVDTSLIPLNAIERIEVEPAGASALYGSDAVGGVVNIVLRRHFRGAQTSVRYGSVTKGGTREVQLGQLGGSAWNSGSVVAGYQFYDRTPLFASDRSYLPLGAQPFTLLPEQVQHSGFASIQQSLSSVANIYGTALYAKRTTHDTSNYGTFGRTLFSIPEGPSVTSLAEAIIGSDIGLASANTLHLSTLWAHSHTHVVGYFDTFPSSNNETAYTVISFNANDTGSLFELPGGPLRFALGGEYRREALNSTDLIAKSSFQPSRRILSGFLELNIPLVAQNSSSSSTPLVSATVAGRIDHYSDFGTTVNPDVGVTWRPSALVKFRSSFGTSFAAPDLSKLNPLPFEVAADSVHDPMTGGLSNVLEVYGGNGSLKPETADVFTAGVDFGGAAALDLRGSITYYHIDFQHLILSIQEGGINPNNGLDLASELGSSIVQRNPPFSEIAALASTPGYMDFTGASGGVNLQSIVAVINSTEQNLARLRTSGIDLDLSYGCELPYGIVRLGFDGTYIGRFERQVTPETPIFSLLNTPYNPIDLKTRGNVAFSRGNWSLVAYLNYVNSYQDNRELTPVPVASWTTVDFNVQYTIPQETGMFSGTALALSITNIADRNAPFVASPSPVAPEVAFDGANANVLGRFISLELRQSY